MVTPLPEIPSDVLSLLDGDFKLLQQAHAGLLKTIQNYVEAVGDMRAHEWLTALRLSAQTIDMMCCDECQHRPYRLGVWPIGRGAWACDRHKAIIDQRIESEHYRPEPKR